MKYVLCQVLIIALVCSINILKAQSDSNSDPIRYGIGDRVPDSLVHYLLKSAYDSGKVQKPRLIILDFWGTFCASCIASFPKMQALQNKFKKSIKIIRVTTQSSEEIDKASARVSLIRNCTLPSITDDSVFANLFPHSTVPTHIWLDSSGFVLAITEGWNTNEKHILQYLVNGKIKMKEKKFNEEFNNQVAIFQEGDGRQQKNIQYYSLITSRLDDYSVSRTGIYRDSATGLITTIRCFNSSLITLFKLAANKNSRRFDFNSDVEIESRHPERFGDVTRDDEHEEWSESNLYCYELHVPALQSEKIFSMMLQDLERYFNVSCSIQRKLKKCWVLKIAKPGLLESNATSTIIDLAADKKELLLQKVQIGTLVMQLRYANYSMGRFPIIDETGYTGLIDMVLNADLTDFDSLNSVLKAYGLKLEIGQRYREVLVISDKNGMPDGHTEKGKLLSD